MQQISNKKCFDLSADSAIRIIFDNIKKLMSGNESIFRNVEYIAENIHTNGIV